MTQHETEISSWAYITHAYLDDEELRGVLTAFDRKTGKKVGELLYFWLDTPRTRIQFKDVEVEEPYRRRKVAKALLRFLNAEHPHARINPGVRTRSGEAFMAHILETEPEKVETNGRLEIPLELADPMTFLPKEDSNAH